MRIPYKENPPRFDDPAEAAVVARVAARRAPRPLQELDLALLHAPPVADGWNSFLGAIRTQTSGIAADLRELAICRVAAINRAWYEWAQHAPLALQAGVEEGALDVLLDSQPFRAGTVSVGHTPAQWAVLVYTDEMTRNVEVSDAAFATLRAHFDDRQVVELTSIIAAYNCVSRFLVALNVGERNGTGAYPDDK